MGAGARCWGRPGVEARRQQADCAALLLLIANGQLDCWSPLLPAAVLPASRHCPQLTCRGTAAPPAQHEQEEKAARVGRRERVAQVHEDRRAQLEEQANRRQVAAELKKRSDAEAAARVAADVKRKMEVCVAAARQCQGPVHGASRHPAGWPAAAAKA